MAEHSHKWKATDDNFQRCRCGAEMVGLTRGGPYDPLKMTLDGGEKGVWVITDGRGLAGRTQRYADQFTDPGMGILDWYIRA